VCRWGSEFLGSRSSSSAAVHPDQRTGHCQHFGPVPCRLVLVQLGRLGDMTAPPDHDRVAALDVRAEDRHRSNGLRKSARRNGRIRGARPRTSHSPRRGSARPSSAATHPSASGHPARPFEGELVPVTRVQVVSHLQRPSARVVVDVQHPHHGHAESSSSSRASSGVGIRTAAARRRGELVPRRSMRLSGPSDRPPVIPAACRQRPTAGNSWSRSPQAPHPGAVAAS